MGEGEHIVLASGREQLEAPAVDGADGARLMPAIKRLIEAPPAMLV